MQVLGIRALNEAIVLIDKKSSAQISSTRIKRTLMNDVKILPIQLFELKLTFQKRSNASMSV